MKRFIICLFAIALCLSLTGCQDKNLPYSSVTRDQYNTGGTLSFEYDPISHVAYFGGEGEIVQYYEQDIAKGWTVAGCRVGVMIAIPQNIKDIDSGKAIVDSQTLTADKFIQINEEMGDYALFQPLVNEDKKEIILEITWQEGIAPQTYKIIIKEGTLFMPAPTQTPTTKFVI